MILVAGIGYIGAALTEKLLSMNCTVVAVNRTLPHSPPPSLRFTCDISEPASVAKLRSALPRPPDIIINCASSGRGGVDAYRKVYLEGTRNLLANFPGSRLLFTGSTSVYAQTDGSWVDETSRADPPRETGQVLLETEHLVTQHGGTVARLGGIYGPARSVVLQRFLQGLSTVDVTPQTRDGRYLNQAHQLDIISALALLSTHSGSAANVYNVTDDHPLSQRQLYAALAERFGLPFPPDALPDTTRKRGWTHKRISNSKLRALGWSPKFPSYIDALDGDPELVPSIESLLSTD